MCMQHFFIKTEKVITAHGNENRSHLGNNLIFTVIFLKNSKDYKTEMNQDANSYHECGTIKNNLLKLTY